VTTDNILAVANREFRVPNILGMRRIASRHAYIELLDCLVRSVVGRKKYMENRVTTPLSNWFTRTDEGFLLLCLESYAEKWNRKWADGALPPRQQQEEGEQKVGEREEARYTGRHIGTRRSWSQEGLERFNALMIDVVRDREENGANFDAIFKHEMINRYSRQNDITVLGGQQQDQPALENCVVQVYSNFNMDQLMAHATATASTGAVAAAVVAGVVNQVML
jgi:hypothetical protein